MAIKVFVEDVVTPVPMPIPLHQGDFEATVVSIPAVIPTPDFCFCGISCETILPAFAGITDLTNDIFDYIFLAVTATDTITMQLYKDGTLVATLNNSTYGEYYGIGDLANPLAKGYQLNMKLVYDAFGTGIYQVKTNSVIMSAAAVSKSETPFYLSPFTEQAAHGTVRVRTVQNGYVHSNPLDYSGMDWPGMRRFYGYFSEETPVHEIDNYQDNSYNWQQIQQQVSDRYTLEIHDFNKAERKAFTKLSFMANELIITDYSIPNEGVYEPVSVSPLEIEDITFRKDAPGSAGTFKFRNKTEADIKRNSDY